MTWLDTQHNCSLPSSSIQSRINQTWECDHCKKQWVVTSQSGPDSEGRYKFWYENIVGDYMTVRRFF